MDVTWTDSADKRGIDRIETMYAIANARIVLHNFQPPRHGRTVPATLFVGPSRFGELEVIVEVGPGRRLHIFHVMRVRPTTLEQAAKIIAQRKDQGES